MQPKFKRILYGGDYKPKSVAGGDLERRYENLFKDARNQQRDHQCIFMGKDPAIRERIQFFGTGQSRRDAVRRKL